MGIMAKNCCTIDMKIIWVRQLAHTIVEALQQWWCFDEQKNIVRIVPVHRLGSMEKALRASSAFVVVCAVGLSFGKTDSTKDCVSGSGSSAGLLRATP